MNINICKRCLNAKDVKIIDSRYYETEKSYRLTVQYCEDDTLCFNIHIWINSQTTKNITSELWKVVHGETTDILSKIEIVSCNYSDMNDFSCPFKIEHQLSDWNKK